MLQYVTFDINTKRIIKTIFVFLMCLVIFCTANNAQAASVRQDVNQDGQINTIDAMLTLKKSLNIDMNGTSWQDTTNTGDVNCDGVLTTADAQLLLKKSLGFDMNGTTWCTAGQNLTVDAGENQYIFENASATLHCSASGADGAVTYKWMQGTTELVSTQDYTTPTLSVGTYTYTCVVTDENGEIASDSMDVVVTSQESSVLYITTEGGGGDYVCNGSQDQVGINEALDRVATDATLTTVYLKGPMTCTIEEPIIISSNTKLLGDANVKVQLKDYTDWPYNKPLIAQKGGEHWEGGAHEGSLADQIYGTTEDAISNVEIGGFELTAGTQSASYGSWYYILMIFYGTSNLTVHDMYLHHSYGDFVRIQSATFGMNNRVKFYNNLMEYSGHDGLYLGYISDLEIYDNKIYHTRTNDGIRVGQCDNISIHGNIVGNSLNNVPSGYAGINIDNDEVSVDSAEIYENYIYGKAGGIVLEGGRTKDFLENAHVHHNRIFKAFDNTAGGDYFLNGGIHIHGAHNTLIENNTIEGSYKDGIVFEIGAGIEDGYQTIVRNNIISNSAGYGLNNIDNDKHTFISEYNDIYNSSAGNYNNASSTTDIYIDPLYAAPTDTNDPNALDLHLKSEHGRWNGTLWVTDSATSPAIDQGKPSSDYSNEPSPNGARVNLGVYGNTSEASKS